MRIAEICPFSAGICGVWARVYSESREFAKLGHQVRVFSSNVEKGNQNLAKCEEDMGEISIRRFRSRSSIISKNVNYFDFEEEFNSFKPDIVITHLIHPHSFQALSLSLKLGIPCYLVTHSPFNVRRRFPLNIATQLFHNFNKARLKKFTKIISITKWEESYLEKLGIEKNKLEYIPNGLPGEFFKQKKIKPAKGKDVLFLGRIAPVKDIETLICAARLAPNVNFDIVGSPERDYLEKIKKLIARLDVKNVNLLPPVYDLRKKIKLIDEHRMFVLPSKREAMPIALLEAISRGKIAISSKTDGGKEIVIDGKNGFLFEIGNYRELAKLIRDNAKGNKKIEKEAVKTAEKFSWRHLIPKYQKLFNKR